ncbi:GntR family transcriptional regulator [Brevibacterium casei]|uniref:DNA-binding transcriptional regulator, GntR family n=2 Tax=Brevibacterium casei TaxID=33889 RepID=A0A2H1HT47_9MICO|nr:GntR family transcriptional regulator [Brevibacterium casei]MCT1551985.1 GntR family transcriptional regulator [Brevibacterium casei]MCT1561806.1 GntR family transcriptional regulator [Brevibacterium casei]MCT2206649.1 GntR family transcriptional regulator [Brevibacterium casei]QPR38392.1 GntR family transcriptional regulator [Brevibacterium casei]QPR42558.1 GntR family transcriptional regulator [Brevibacterium casei]
MPGRDTDADSSVYARIKAMILDGTVPPGERITIDRMARELGVSQTPVREAMQRLEGDKLVRTRQPRGYATTPLLTRRDLEMMIEVRLLIEPWAARMVAVDRASNPGRELLTEVESFAADPDGSDWKQELFQHDSRFHLRILEATGNTFLLDAYRQMRPHLHLFRLYPGDPHGIDTSHEHGEIARAIAECDPDAAEAAMREHILHALTRFSASTEGGAGSDGEAGSDGGPSDAGRGFTDAFASVLGRSRGTDSEEAS